MDKKLTVLFRVAMVRSSVRILAFKSKCLVSCVYRPFARVIEWESHISKILFVQISYSRLGPPTPRLDRRRPLAWRSKTGEITPSQPQFTPKPRWNDSNQRFQDDTRLYYSGFVTKNPIVVGSLSGKFRSPAEIAWIEPAFVGMNNRE